MQPLTLEKPTYTIRGAVEGIRISIALLIAGFPEGMVFGILARHAGMTLLESTMMSAFVYAGSAQFASLDLWITPLPVFTLLITTFAINLRYMLMGAAIRQYYSDLKIHQTYTSVFFMGDESWALAIREFSTGGRNAALMIGSGIAQWFVWVGSTAFGYVLSSSIQNPSRWGLDFVFTGVFAAILAGMFKSKSDLLPWGIAAVVALMLSHFVPGKWYILGGGIAGTLAGYLRGSDET